MCFKLSVKNSQGQNNNYKSERQHSYKIYINLVIERKETTLKQCNKKFRFNDKARFCYAYDWLAITVHFHVTQSASILPGTGQTINAL